MNPYDVTPDDEPLDVRAVGEDDLLVEQLRHALSPDAAVVWDDDDDDLDPAFALLRALQKDVSADLPVGEPILPAGVTELVPRRRLTRTATVAVVAAGVLSIAGAAAASAPGQPLAGVRDAVSHAVSHAVEAITPHAPARPAAKKSARPSPTSTPPGEAVSTAARSTSAVKQIEAELDLAAAFIDKGRYQPAKNELAAAASNLRYVTDPAVEAGLQTRLTALQARLAAMPTAKPTHGPSSDTGTPADKGQPADKGKSADNGKSGDKGKSADKGNAGNGNGSDGEHSGKGADATHKPTAAPSKESRPSGADEVKNDATPQAVATESPSPHKGGKD